MRSLARYQCNTLVLLMNRRRLLLSAAAGFAAAPAARACLWDRDTLAMERERFPTALELITGKFLRRSFALYLWRIDDRIERLSTDPENLALQDDLAVAYDKTGQHDKAIALATAMRARKPGRYETEANLGTFYIHAGDREQGLRHIRAALKINPDAHFGREKYQALLAEYVLLRLRENNGTLRFPLGGESSKQQAAAAATHEDAPAGAMPRSPAPAAREIGNFHEFVLSRAAASARSKETAAAVRGVLGMMKFGNFESPVLLEALGDLLLFGSVHHTERNAAQLAARAYLKASYHVKNAAARAEYRRQAENVLRATPDLTLDTLEAQLKREIDEARAWFAAVEANEKQWIAEGRNPDEAFERTYYQAPSIASQPGSSAATQAGDVLRIVAATAAFLAASGGAWWYKRRRETRKS